MTPLILDNESNDINWKRKCRDAVNAIAKRLTGAGVTGVRPAVSAAAIGTMYYDTSLGKPIWLHATGVWKDAAGTTV